MNMYELFFLFQCRKLPNFFLQNVNILRGKSPAHLDAAAKAAWSLFRELLVYPEALENLWSQEVKN